jgi:hypothetical protein
MDDPLRLDHQVVSVEAGKVIVFANHRIGEELAKLPPATGTKGQLAGSEPGKRGKGKKGGSGRSRKKQPDKSAPTLKESVGSRTRGTRLKKLGNTPKDVVEAAAEKLADEGKDITGDQRERCCGSKKGGTTYVPTVQSSLARPLSAAAFKARSSAWSTQIVTRSASVDRRPSSFAALTNAVRSIPSASTSS